MRAFIEENFLYLRPDVELDGRRTTSWRSGSSTRSGSSSWSRRSSPATRSAIDDVEITEENFGSIDAITGFVERKRARGVSIRTIAEDLSWPPNATLTRWR